MAEFLELLETIRADEATMQKLFGDAGEAVRERGEKYQAKLAEAAKLVSDVIQGKRPMYLLKEAMTTADFPYLFGDILDRQLLANYREWAPAWNVYAKQRIVPDFRTVKSFAIGGGEAVLSEVAQLTEYPAAALTESPYSYAVKKYGRRIPFSWETLINDDLGAFMDVPERLARAARRSEDKFATGLHVDSNGPHASVYTSGNKNIINTTNGASINNPDLDIAGLQDGMKVLGNMVDGDGEPIVVDAVILEVGPALEITAQNILNAVQLWLDANASAGTPNQNLVTQNWMRNRVKLVVNPYVPIVATTNGATSWFLHAAPSNRPFCEMGFLRGHAEPEIFMKSPNASRVGGGQINPLDGDFETDSIEYKVRHVFGGSVIDPKMSVGSNGTNT